MCGCGADVGNPTTRCVACCFLASWTIRCASAIHPGSRTTPSGRGANPPRLTANPVLFRPRSTPIAHNGGRLRSTTSVVSSPPAPHTHVCLLRVVSRLPSAPTACHTRVHDERSTSHVRCMSSFDVRRRVHVREDGRANASARASMHCDVRIVGIRTRRATHATDVDVAKRVQRRVGVAWYVSHAFARVRFESTSNDDYDCVVVLVVVASFVSFLRPRRCVLRCTCFASLVLPWRGRVERDPWTHVQDGHGWRWQRRGRAVSGWTWEWRRDATAPRWTMDGGCPGPPWTQPEHAILSISFFLSFHLFFTYFLSFLLLVVGMEMDGEGPIERKKVRK